MSVLLVPIILPSFDVVKSIFKDKDMLEAAEQAADRDLKELGSMRFGNVVQVPLLAMDPPGYDIPIPPLRFTLILPYSLTT